MERNDSPYFLPDPIWTYTLGNETLEKYLENQVVKGRFVSTVPEDVLKSYETVEFLMAHAYYHWPMYDEAVKKLLSIVEMAVKMRCMELGIELQSTNNSGRRFDKRLVDLIDALVDYGYPQIWIQRLHWARVLRNGEAHPDRHSFGGGIKKAAVKRTLIIINTLFTDPQVLTQNLAEQERMEQAADAYSGFYIMKHEKGNILVCDPRPVHARYIHDRWVYGFYLQQVRRDTALLLQQNRIPDPIVVFLHSIEQIDEGLTAVDAINGQVFGLLSSEKPEYQQLYSEHLKALDEADVYSQYVYKDMHDNRIAKEIHEFDYLHTL